MENHQKASQYIGSINEITTNIDSYLSGREDGYDMILLTDEEYDMAVDAMREDLDEEDHAIEHGEPYPNEFGGNCLMDWLLTHGIWGNFPETKEEWENRTD